MTRNELDNLKATVIEKKEVARDMKTVAEKINNLPKGQLKKVLTDDILNIFNKYKED